MAYVQNIPIYTSTYNFVRETYRLKLKMPKNIKYDLGNDLCDSALKILKLIVLSNKSQDKIPHLSRLLLETEVQWVFLRLAYDLRGISSGELKVLSEKLTEIEKQARAWLKWEKQASGSQKKY